MDLSNIRVGSRFVYAWIIPRGIAKVTVIKKIEPTEREVAQVDVLLLDRAFADADNDEWGPQQRVIADDIRPWTPAVELRFNQLQSVTNQNDVLEAAIMADIQIAGHDGTGNIILSRDTFMEICEMVRRWREDHKNETLGEILAEVGLKLNPATPAEIIAEANEQRRETEQDAINATQSTNAPYSSEPLSLRDHQMFGSGD